MAISAKPWTGVCRVADWFAQLNNKMGGDLKKIQTVGQVPAQTVAAVAMAKMKVIPDS